jgi:hypothetical protein
MEMQRGNEKLKSSGSSYGTFLQMSKEGKSIWLLTNASSEHNKNI